MRDGLRPGNWPGGRRCQRWIIPRSRISGVGGRRIKADMLNHAVRRTQAKPAMLQVMIKPPHGPNVARFFNACHADQIAAADVGRNASGYQRCHFLEVRSAGSCLTSCAPTHPRPNIRPVGQNKGSRANRPASRAGASTPSRSSRACRSRSAAARHRAMRKYRAHRSNHPPTR